MNHNQSIGIDRRIRLEWLEETARLYKEGLSAPEIASIMINEVGKYLSVNKSAVGRGSGEKAVSNLMKIWIRVPSELESLRDTAISLFNSTPREFHIALHWGMTCAVYPFWENVASQVGRLLKLQSNVTPAQVQRRMKEKYGERSTVKDATRRAIRSMYDWGVLEATDKQGIYKRGLALKIDIPKLNAWIAETLLYAHGNGSYSYKDILESPSLFPFQLMRLPVENLIAESSRLELLRYSLDDELLMLKT